MHRLFWKIFLSFWIALVLFAVASMFAASRYIDHMRAEHEAMRPHARIEAYVAEARAAVAGDGVDGLKAWLRRLDRREVVPYYLLDPAGEDLLGRPLPPELRRRLERRAVRPVPPSWLPARETVRTPDGTDYQLVPDFRGVTLGRVLSRPRVMALPVLVAALVGGLVCLLLARYLTTPLGRLRRATERLAAGDLGHRVAPSMGRRRDEIASLAAAFDDMAGRLEQLMASQRQLVRDVSHELRSPLARLQVALGLVRQKEGAHAAAELDRIEREAERLEELVAQLLSLARLESDIAAVPRDPVDLAELVEAVVADAAYEARAQGRDVRLLGVCAGMVEGDPALLHSAVENVVRNAVRYTDEGTTVEVSLDAVPSHPGTVRVQVRDHGPGVPEAMLGRLAEPFVRVGDARDRPSGGYGLGLAIARRAVRAHGGTLTLANAPGGGLLVVLTLPLR